MKRMPLLVKKENELIHIRILKTITLKLTIVQRALNHQRCKQQALGKNNVSLSFILASQFSDIFCLATFQYQLRIFKGYFHFVLIEKKTFNMSLTVFLVKVLICSQSALVLATISHKLTNLQFFAIRPNWWLSNFEIFDCVVSLFHQNHCFSQNIWSQASITENTLHRIFFDIRFSTLVPLALD